MQKQINARISHKHDTEANWLKIPTFVPEAGELIVYDKDDTHTFARAKIGDGATAVGSLPFLHEFVTGTASQYLSFDANGKMTAKALATSVSEGDATAVTSGAVYEHIEDQAHSIADSMRTMMNGGVSWNGSFDGRVTVGINDATSGTFAGYVHVSDDLPPADLFPGSYCSMAMAIYDEKESSQAKYRYSAVTYTPDIIGTLFNKPDDYSHRLFMYVAFITEDNYTSDGVTFPKKGTYFYVAGEYLSDGTKVAKEYICGFSMTNYYYPHPSLSAYMESNGASLGDTIIWDGSTDGYAVYDDELVHMTTNVPDPALFVGDNIIEVTTISNGVKTVSNPECVAAEMSPGLYYLFYEAASGDTEAAGIVIPQPFTAGDGTTLQGLIFFINGNPSDDGVRSYVSKLTIPGFNFISANGVGGGDVFKREYLPGALRFGEYIEAEYGNSLTWDGTVGNRDALYLDGTTVVRIGDTTMTLDQIISGELTASVVDENGNTDTGLSIAGYEMVEGKIAVIGIDSTVFGFYVAQDDYMLDGVIFPKKGFYLVNLGFYVSEITTSAGENLFITRDAGFTKIGKNYLPTIVDNAARAGVTVLSDRMDSAESVISSLKTKVNNTMASKDYTNNAIAEKHKVYGKAVFFGDSVGQGVANNLYSYVDMLSESGSFESVEKYCVGGTSIGPYTGVASADEQCLVNIIDTHAAAIQNADLIFLEYGGNDAVYASGGNVATGYVTDTSADTTICGYLRKSLEKIKALNPTARIIWLSLCRWKGVGRTGLANFDAVQLADTLLYYEATAVRIMLEFDCTIIDIGDGFEYTDYCADGIHPNTQGHRYITQNILNNMFKNNIPRNLHREFTIKATPVNGTYTYSVDGSFFYALAMLKSGGIDVTAKLVTDGIQGAIIMKPQYYTETFIGFLGHASLDDPDSSVHCWLAFWDSSDNIAVTSAPIDGERGRYGKAVFFGDSLCGAYGNYIKDSQGNIVYMILDSDGNKTYFFHSTTADTPFYVEDENGSHLVHRVARSADDNTKYYFTADNGDTMVYQASSDMSQTPYFQPAYYYDTASGALTTTCYILNAPYGCVEYLRESGIFTKVTNNAISGTTLGSYGNTATYKHELCFLNIFDKCSDDIAEADYVFLEFLGHDIGCYMRGEVEIGTPEDPDTATTICGCIKKAINRIRAINPDVKIIWVPDGKISYYMDDPSSHYQGGHDSYDARIVAEASAYRTIEQMNVQIICISEGFDFLNCEDLLQYGNHPGPIGHTRVANVIRDNINSNNEVPYLGRTYHIGMNADNTFFIDGQYKYCYEMLKLGGIDINLQFVNMGVGANLNFRPMWYTAEYISFVSYIVIGSWLNVVTAVWAADGTVTLSYEQVNNDHEYVATDTGTTDANGNAIVSISGGTWQDALNYIQSSNATVRVRATSAEMGVAIFTPQSYHGDNIYFSAHTMVGDVYVTIMIIWNRSGTATMKYFMS